MKQILIKYFAYAAVLALPIPVFAASIFERIGQGAKDTANSAYGGGDEIVPKDLPTALILIINSLLTFLGILFFLLMMYAGYLWLTAHGKEEQVDKAKRIMRETVIGIIIVFMARLISELVLSLIGKSLLAS